MITLTIMGLLVVAAVVIILSSKKLKYLASKYDWIWSILLAVGAFIGAGILLQYVFGKGVGVFDPSYLQKAFLAAFYMVVGNAVVLFGLWFNMRGIYRYFYGKEIKDEFKNISTWQKVLLFVSLYCFLQLEYTLILLGIA